MEKINWKIDRSWSLFLDRDGVINKRLPGDFVKNWDEFEFLPDATSAIARFSEKFGLIFIVTNQRGINEGIYTEGALLNVHHQMEREIALAGGRIDKIFYCKHSRAELCDCRKPETGMALQAIQLFAQIDFSKSIMVGDREGDMFFGKSLNMKTVFILNDLEKVPEEKGLVDVYCSSLKELAELLEEDLSR